MARRGGARTVVFVASLLCGACSAGGEGGAVLFDRDYVLETFATNSDGITSPDGLAWYGGSLLVADEGGSAIRRLGRDGWETLADRSSGIISPEDLAVATNGTIYFTDDSAGGVWTVTEAGARRLPWPEMLDTPTEGIALAPDGWLIVGETRGRRLAHYSPVAGNGGRNLAQAQITKPESIAFDAIGNLYVADNEDNVIYRWDAAGTVQQALSWPQVSPESIAVVGDALWLTDSENGKIYRLTPGEQLETVAIFAGHLQNVSGIAGDNDGNVYVSIQTDLEKGQGVIVVLRRRGSQQLSSAQSRSRP